MIESVNNIGYVRVRFSRSIDIPTYDRYPEFREPYLLRKNCTNGDLEACSNVTNSEANVQGPPNDQRQKAGRLLLSAKDQELQEALEITNKGMIMVNKTLFPII